MWFGGNPADSGLWIADLLGEGLIQSLRERRDNKYKISKIEEKEIAIHYKQQFKIIEEKRLNGQTGFIDFMSYQ